MCYVENSIKDLKCIVCNFVKFGFFEFLFKIEGEDVKIILISINIFVVEFVELNIF